MPIGSAAWTNRMCYLRMQALLLDAIGEQRKPQVFEWGPGFSTLFFAMRHCEIVAVEHEEMWYKAQLNNIEQAKFTNIDVRYRPPGLLTNPVFDPSDPWQFSSKDDPTRDYRDYVQEIHAKPMMYDLIYVDGRARPGCIRAAEQHVAPGGHIAMHDSHREHYKRAREHLADWKREDIPDGQSQLTIWGRE